jgi:hypothetical protein
MATKIISADKILMKKGVKRKEFDTNAFSELVGTFFETHEVKETILLVPKRFVEMENPPQGDFIDYTDVSIWERKADDPDDPFDFTNYLYMRNKGLLRPIIYINEPFIGNAAAYLRVLCGFIVKPQTKNKKKMFVVSLPI